MIDFGSFKVSIVNALRFLVDILLIGGSKA